MKKKVEKAKVQPVVSKKYWYFITEYICVLCNRINCYRERRFDEKPKNYWDRHKEIEMACWSHF